MSTPPDQPNGSGATNPRAALANALSALVEVMRERSAIQHEIAQRGVALAENAEQLQYDLAVRQIEAASIRRQRRQGLVPLLVIFAGTALLFLLALAGLVVAMAFFGSPTQSQTALTLLSYGFAALGGGAVFLAAVIGVKAAFQWSCPPPPACHKDNSA